MVEKENEQVVNEILKHVRDWIFSKSQDNIVDMDISDTGALLLSGETRDEFLTAILEYPVPHAAPVNDGTDPHSISEDGQEAIKDWARRKLGLREPELTQVANKIIWKIRKLGTEPKPFLDEAISEASDSNLGILDLT